MFSDFVINALPFYQHCMLRYVTFLSTLQMNTKSVKTKALYYANDAAVVQTTRTTDVRNWLHTKGSRRRSDLQMTFSPFE